MQTDELVDRSQKVQRDELIITLMLDTDTQFWKFYCINSALDIITRLLNRTWDYTTQRFKNKYDYFQNTTYKKRKFKK